LKETVWGRSGHHLCQQFEWIMRRRSGQNQRGYFWRRFIGDWLIFWSLRRGQIETGPPGHAVKNYAWCTCQDESDLGRNYPINWSEWPIRDSTRDFSGI
jgi:hypothetical protein